MCLNKDGTVKYQCCDNCEGGGDVCKHPERLGDDCPEGLDDCDSCDFLKQCSECDGAGMKPLPDQPTAPLEPEGGE